MYNKTLLSVRKTKHSVLQRRIRAEDRQYARPRRTAQASEVRAQRRYTASATGRILSQFEGLGEGQNLIGWLGEDKANHGDTSNQVGLGEGDRGAFEVGRLWSKLVLVGRFELNQAAAD